MASTDQPSNKGSFGSLLHKSDKKRMVFAIHNFKDLTEKKGHKTTFAECHGRQWQLWFYPWGGTEEAKANENMSLYLAPKDNAESLKTSFEFLVDAHRAKFCITFEKGTPAWGSHSFCKRSDILGALDENGSLNITVELQCWFESAPVWKPQNLLKRKMQRLYDSRDDADVAFIVGNGREVTAHKSIISLQCPLLDNIVSEVPDPTNVILDNTNPDLFGLLVHFMYFEDLPSSFLVEKDGVELLKMANRFGYIDLKMHLEADLVSSKIVSLENAAELLLLADSHTCALLKEQAMDWVVGNFDVVMKTTGWKELTESNTLLAELLQAHHSPTEKSESVSILRKKLAVLGEDVDGTKEMLLKRLKKHGCSGVVSDSS